MTVSPAPRVAVVVVAAGSGSRLGHASPKAFVALHGRPVLAHALDSVFGMREAVQVVVVAPHTHLDEARAIALRAVGAEHALVDVVAGGATRQQSVGAGLAVLRSSVDVVLVHDAARALTPAALCDAVVDAVRRTGHGIIPGLPLVDTIKRVDPAGTILATVDRAELSAVQTPQGFPLTLLAAARAAAGLADDMTDDAALVASAGHPVSVIAGDPLAFKITTPDDLRRAELLLDVAPTGAEPADTTPRIGSGLDVHAYSETAELWLAGLFWPGERGLSGHSDGDAAVHAICDALLGAAGLGDIGIIFGTADARFAGAHGEVFLTETLRLIGEAGFRVGNVSVQIVGNRPRLAPRRAEAERLLSGILRAPVNIAATTTDALGFTGRGEGVAATASALLIPVAGRTPDLSWGM